MVRTVIQIGRQPNHRIAGQNALLHCFQESLFDCREIVLRHRTAHHALGKGQPVALSGREADLHIAVLSVTAGLLFMFALHIASALDGFPVGDPGSGQHHIQTVAALQLGKRHIDLHIAHCRKEQLLGLGIVFKAQGFILVQQPVDALSNLVFLALVLGGDSHGVEGFRIFHAGIFHLARFRQGIARTGAHQFGNYADVAAGKSLNLGGLFTDNSGKVRHFFGNRSDCSSGSRRRSILPPSP